MTPSAELSPVRSGEELNVAALQHYLETQNIVAAETGTLEVKQFPGGHSNLTYLITFRGREFVLRRPPVGPVAPTAHDMPREFRLLSAINPHFPLAPKPVLLCEDPSICGVPFYLMERRRGMILRSNVPAQFDDLSLRRALSENVVDTLATLHAVDIETTGINQIGKPAGFVERQVRGWADRWERSRTHESAAMEAVIRWLEARIPAECAWPAIVHNDFKLDNVMLDEEDPSRIVAVLDWEMTTVGDPLIDVGLFLAYWTMNSDAEGDNASLRAITNGPGWLTRDEIINRYRIKSGRDLSDIVFYETFALFKVAVIIQQIYFRFVQGQTRDPRFRNFNLLVAQLANSAQKLTEGSVN